ncbi:DUF3576 domain-containing protein [Acidisoma silvae]|uniref:DUF3576 domain-containing protein n=1 Tax=Acidisoma silvae TaxID=2802396 RepID=A0A963YRP3_9PROT|nr:DUF3576 domain-containing protein [Acidisoma silvae]MCB8875514.1 DUF3576 domain-containing protein [Acidisoma silvae]
MELTIRTSTFLSRGFAAAALAGVLALTACGNAPSTPVDPLVLNGDEVSGAGFKNGGGLLGADGLAFGINKNPHANGGSGGATAGIGVNAYLWRGALDTLSFMPLSSADPFGGVIITDWYQPPGDNGERYKATAYILGQDLRADGVRVTVFKQVMQGGQWTDAEVSPGTNEQVEDKVLARARQLRVQSATN